MSTFGGVYFTNKGKALQAKALTGIQLNFTKLVVGDGNLTGQVIADLTALVHEVKSLPIATLKNTQDGKVTIGGVLSNQGLVAGFYWRELGLFATDPDIGEILYCYGNAAALAEYIPAGGGADLLEKQINIVAIIGNATSVSATIDSSLIYASPGDVATALAQAEAYAEPKITTTTSTDYWNGTKTFRNLATDVRAIILTGLSTATNAAITAADSILIALGKLQKQIADNLTTVNSHLTDNLLRLDIKGTTQNVTVVSNQVTQILHKDSSSNVIRTDVFTYGTNLITEVRTLTAGGTVTFKYHLDTLQTEVI